MIELANPDSLSRTAKMFADSGEAPTLGAAEAILKSFVLQLHVGQVRGNRSLQAAVLTIVNTGVRAFKGGVHVRIIDDFPMDTGWCRGMLLSTAVERYGARLVETTSADHPTICVGDSTQPVSGRPLLRATVDGWTAGVVEGTETPLLEADTFTPAGVAAGGIAVAEAFEYRRGTNVYAGRRDQGVSLWKPSVPWLSADAIGPDDVTYAPRSWWLVGLGHLGQAYLSTIGMLPYAKPGDIRLLLQDDDFITEANESTGMLLEPGSVVNELKTRKTRRLADVLEERGFTTAITERRLFRGDGPRGDEPQLALIGVDNPETRRWLSDSDFALTIEAGLGGGPAHYLDLQAHTFPSGRLSDTIAGWQGHRVSDSTLLNLPAYRNLSASTGDECGTVEVAGRSVAASFVGATAGALVVAEAVRALRADHRYAVIDASLRDLATVVAVEAVAPAVANLGYADLE